MEGHNFDIRKRLLDYDDVLNKQREVVYGERRTIVDADAMAHPTAMREQVKDYITAEIESVVAFHTADGADWNVREVFENMKTIVDVNKKTRDQFMEFDGVKAPKSRGGGQGARRAHQGS